MSEQSKNINHFFSEGPCLYLPTRESMIYLFSVKTMTPATYEKVISEGFRRNGRYFYQNLCPNCKACIPIRVDAQKFRPTKSHRRVLKKNQDVKIIRDPVAFDNKDFLLYQKYCIQRHGSFETKENYVRFLIESPLPTKMMRYYNGTELIGIGWIDILPHSISSVYFAFDPDCSFRSLGVFSLLKELELCKKLKKRWLHLGFWIKENPKMSYKSQYKPCQILIDRKWQEMS